MVRPLCHVLDVIPHISGQPFKHCNEFIPGKPVPARQCQQRLSLGRDNPSFWLSGDRDAPTPLELQYPLVSK